MIALTLIASIIVTGIMLFYGFEQWHVAYERNWKSDTVWGVRLWIPYLALPLGFGLGLGFSGIFIGKLVTKSYTP